MQPGAPPEPQIIYLRKCTLGVPGSKPTRGPAHGVTAHVSKEKDPGTAHTYPEVAQPLGFWPPPPPEQRALRVPAGNSNREARRRGWELRMRAETGANRRAPAVGGARTRAGALGEWARPRGHTDAKGPGEGGGGGPHVRFAVLQPRPHTRHGRPRLREGGPQPAEGHAETSGRAGPPHAARRPCVSQPSRGATGKAGGQKPG